MRMEEYMCGDIWTWLQDIDGRVFRYWVYRRMFTPLETEKKYIDEGYFEDSECNFGIIRECVQLPDGDFLIGFEYWNPDMETPDEFKSITYYKLSELRLEYYPKDVMRDDEFEEE